jgi:hypothetical protein
MARQGQQGPGRGSGRPAGHASALQIDGSHRLHSQRSLVRGKEEAWGGPLAGSGTGPQVSSLARASAVHRQPPGRQPGGPRIAPGTVPEQQQATRVRPQSARKEHSTLSNSVRSQGVEYWAGRDHGCRGNLRDSAGFQVLATRSQCASDPGSWPGIAVACTQHRVRAAAGCAHNGRPTGTGAGHRTPIISGSSKDQVSRGRYIRSPGQRARGANISGYNSERSYATDIGHDGGPSEHQPRCCQISVLSRARKYRRWVRAGGPPGAPILLHVYLPTAEATKNGGAGLDL